MPPSSGKHKHWRHGKLWESLPGFTFGSPDPSTAENSVDLLTYYVVAEGCAEVRVCRFTVS